MANGRLPISCIYTAQVRPFVRKGVLCAICIYTLWRRLLLLLILDIVGSLIPRRTRIAEVMAPAPFLLDSFVFLLFSLRESANEENKNG